MALSERQLLFAKYLMERIGYEDSTLVSWYLTKLERIHGTYIRESETVRYPSGYYGERYWYRYSASGCISELLQEIQIKKNLGSIILKDTSTIPNISATNLSSFNFCPASYSIGKSFEIQHPSNEDKRLLGIDLHETLRLLHKKIPNDWQDQDIISSDIAEHEKIKKIRSCKLIFLGHSEKKQYFTNFEKKYIGQPDYIFQDPNGKYFVVEEKFKYQNRNDNKTERYNNYFHENHIVQLQSYIDYIKDYNIDYGILIYWFYDFPYNYPFIHSISIKVIRKNEYSQLLEKTFNNLNKLNSTKEMTFEKANQNKCAACVVNKYCAHKTNKLRTFNLPYNRYFMRLKYIDFPEELKNNSKDNEENHQIF